MKIKEIKEEYVKFPTIKMKMGMSVMTWKKFRIGQKTVVEKLCSDPSYDVKALNFSTYGASFVGIDEDRKTHYSHLQLPEGFSRRPS
jgi:L-fuculokinase